MKPYAALAIFGGAFAFPAVSVRDSTPYGMPLDWTPFGFTTDVIKIGTPPQQVTSFVDWTWIGQYAFTARCHGSLDDTYDCLQPGQPIFNQTESTTFVNQTALYPFRVWNPNHFFFYDPISVGFGSDIEQLGDHSARITIMAADMEFTLQFAYPFAGVFGLSPVFKSDNASTESPFYQMWKQGAFPSPIISFQYCYNSTFGNPAPARALCSGNDAMQTLGGASPALTMANVSDPLAPVTWYDNIVFPPVNDIDFIYSPGVYNYWALYLAKHMIGDEEQALNTTTASGHAGAIFDHASYGRGAPVSTNSYKRLIELTGARPIVLDSSQAPNNGNQSFVSVDCTKVHSFPPLKYEFVGNNRVWEVIPENYVEEVTVANETACVLNVRTLGEGDFLIGNFGETFAKDKVVLFDFEKLRVGVTDIPQTATM